MDEQARLILGNVMVKTTINGGHPPEHYAERLADKLISIGEEAPQEIRDQAHAFREHVIRLAYIIISQAIASNHTTLVAMLEREGHKLAAEFLRNIK